MLGVTEVLSKADYHLPTKWYAMIDSLRASSGAVHARLSTLDEDVEREFRHKEEMLERRFGSRKFYEQEEIDELREKINEIKI